MGRVTSKKKTKKGKKTTCPVCDGQISYLITREDVIDEYIVWLDEKEKMKYNKTDKYDSPTGIRFYCPKCGEELATSREKAKKILKGEV